MSIPVTCPECQSHFHVGEEFAGVAGRCPECAAVIHVPDPAAPDHHPEPEPPPAEELDLTPYSTPRRVEAFDELPAPAGRRRDRDERRDDDDRPRDRREPDRPRFDPVVRAARWEGVSRGLRNLMVAVVLATINLLVITAFMVTDEIKPAINDNFVGRKVALWFGTTVVLGICMLLWMVGRFGCARVPYVPARQVAVPAAVVAGIAGVCGVLALAMSAIGILMVQQGNLGGADFIGLGVCGLMPVTVGLGVAELLGLSAQVRMADGLGDLVFGRTSRVLFVVSLVLTGLSVCGGCGFFVLLAAAAQQAQQQQMKQQQQARQPPPIVAPKPAVEPKPPAVKDKEAPPPPVKAKEPPTRPAEKGPPPRVVERPDEAKAAPPDNDAPAAAAPAKGGPAVAPPANPPPAKPPGPVVEPAEQRAVIYALTIFTLVMALAYAGFCVVCLQSGRRAIRREVRLLTGDPHDEHH